MKKNGASICNLQHVSKLFAASSLAICAFLASCGGGGGVTICTEAPPRTFTTAQVQAMSPADVTTLTDVELLSIGTDIQYLSNSGLSALRNTVSNPNLMCSPHRAQLEALTSAQIGVLSPVQVRYLGSAGGKTGELMPG